jgi:thioredoxin 1
MHKQLLKVTVIVLLAFVFLTPAFADEIDDQLSNVGKNSSPVLIEFGATWCIPCQQMQPVMKKVEGDYQGRLSVIVVDTDKRRDLAKTFGVRVMPTLVFLDEKGKEFKRLFGGSSYEEITAVLKTKGL